MKPSSLRGLAALAAVLLVPLLVAPALAVDFNADDTIGIAPHPVNFTLVIDGTPDSVWWIFTNNDASAADTTKLASAPWNTQHIFATPDTLGYDVKMIPYPWVADSTVEKYSGATQYIVVNPPPQVWGTQLSAHYVTHWRLLSYCDEAGVDSAMNKWHFDAYPNDLRVPVLTFGIINNGVLDNLDSVWFRSLFPVQMGYAIDSLYLYKDNGDSVFSAAADTAIDSLEIPSTGFGWGETAMFDAFKAEMVPGATTYFHLLVGLDYDTLRANPAAFTASLDSIGLAVMIPEDSMHTELQNGGQSHEVQNICYDFFMADGAGAPPKEAAYNIMLNLPTWGESQELHAWYVNDQWVSDGDSCNASGYAAGWGSWYFEAFARDDKVPLLTFAFRNNGPLDTLRSVTITSRFEAANSVSRLWLYQDMNGDSVYNAGDYELHLENTPGAFAAGGTLALNSMNIVFNPGDVKYFHVVGEMNTAVIEASPPSFDGKGMGIDVMGQFVMAPSSWSMVDPVEGTGLHTGADGAVILTDAGQAWTGSALIGMTMTNLTDGSVGTVSANTATTVTVSGGLSGGTDNDWDTDDQYEITLLMALVAPDSSLVQNPCYDGSPANSPPTDYNAIIQVPNWGDELVAYYVSDSLLLADCDAAGVTAAMDKWHWDVGPFDSAVVMTFGIMNAGPQDTITSLAVTSENELTQSLTHLTLYQDNGDSVFTPGSETFIAQLTVSGTEFDSDSALRFDALGLQIPGFDTTYYHVVGMLNTAQILSSAAIYESFDSAGLGMRIDPDSIQVVAATGANALAQNPCYTADPTNKPSAFNAIVHTLNWGDDLFTYNWGIPDSTPKLTCGSYPTKIPALLFGIRHVTPYGNDTMMTLRVTSRIEEDNSITRLWLYRDNGDRIWNASDTFVDSISVGSTFGDGDTISFHGALNQLIPQQDTTHFFILVDLDESAICSSPLLFMCKSIDLDVGLDDIGMRFAFDQSQVVTDAGAPNIKINSIPLQISTSNLIFDLWYDADGNGYANIGDSVRVRATLTANNPVSGMIDLVWADLGHWSDSMGVAIMEDAAGDYNFEAHILIDNFAGKFDTIPGSPQLKIWVHAMDTLDYSCNEDSAQVTFDTSVPIVDLMAPTHWGYRDFSKWADVNGNGCLGLGDSIKIELAYGDSVGKMDLDSVFANLLDAGLGGPVGGIFDRQPLGQDSTVRYYDTVSVFPLLINVTDTTWFSLLWELQQHPQDSSVDAAGGTLNVELIGMDDAWNFDTTMTINIVESVDTKLPLAITGLAATALPNGGVRLCWSTDDADAEYFLIYHDSAGVRGGFPDSAYSVHDSAVINGSALDDGSMCWTSDLTTNLQDGAVYKFLVRTMDNCGNVEYNANVVAVMVDGTPANSCIFQPEAGGLYSQSMPLTVYVEPATDTADIDVKAVKARGRLLDKGDGNPGPWVDLSGWETQTLTGSDVNYAIDLDTAGLNMLVGDDSTQTVQLVILTQDEVGNTNTDAEALAACSPVFYFDWANWSLVGQIVTVDGNLPLYQPFCNVIGYDVWGSANEVAILVSGGTPPYAVQAKVGSDEVYYGEGLAASATFNLDVSGYDDGTHSLTVEWTDAGGATTTAAASLCVGDSIAPCAIISSPVDGKCIRRSQSIDDKIDVTVQLDPLNNCLDTTGVLKVDFQWAVDCCELFSRIECRDSVWWDTTSGQGGGNAVCDTFPSGAIGNAIDSVNCVDTTTGGYTIVRRDSTICDTIPCEDLWHTFEDDRGIMTGTGASSYTFSWMNQNDLSFIQNSGELVYLRAKVYDDQGNVFITPCVQVCVDIDTPPMCLTSPDLCGTDDAGVAKISGDGNTVVASIDFAVDNIDDIEFVYVTWKKSTDPDVYSSWSTLTAMTPATNDTYWRYDGLNTTSLTNQVYYDFRIIVKTIWDTWSHDTNGDNQFDDHTFDSSKCDMTTWFVDNWAPNVWIDTVWTMIGENELIQPNVSCKLSDPRGWAWAQYGNDITVQALVEPFGDASDIVKVEWKLYDGDYASCASCALSGPDSCYYIQVFEGAGAATQKLTFNPADAPFVNVENGVQTHVLEIVAYDACGNSVSECIELHLLDVDPSDAIIITPKNHEVICDADCGCIEFTAATLLDEAFKVAYFKWRVPGGTWTDFDTVTAGSNNFTGTLTSTWYPRAQGLDDGTYEVTVQAEDYAGNVQTNLHVRTVHLSCGVPAVTLDHPFDSMFIGCPLELQATATAPDAYNYITKVGFYYQSVTGATPVLIGEDEYSVDGKYSYHWTPAASLDGDYYVFAVVTVKSGATATSQMVWVMLDTTNPEVNLVQVAGDRSDGGAADPTTVTAGDVVTVYAEAWERLQADGYGPEDNCGLDSVKIYVQNASGTVVFGKLMTPVSDTLFTADWPTADLPNGVYRAYANAADSCCNNTNSANWYIEIVNPPDFTVSVDEALFFCDSWRTNADTIHTSIGLNDQADYDSVQIWYNASSKSDVYDQYTKVASSDSVTSAGVFFDTLGIDISGWSEGTYRLRAVAWIGGRATDDGNDSDSEFDDFTFNDSKLWQMLLVIDRSVTPFAVSHDATLEAHEKLDVTVTPNDACDVDGVCYGVFTNKGVHGEHGCGGTTYSFDPIDSGFVSLHEGMWYGWLSSKVTDPLGNETTVLSELYILDIEDTQAMVVSPLHGDYVNDTLVTLVARKLSVSDVSEVSFYYGSSASDAGTLIDAEVTQSGDMFTVVWNNALVSDGMVYVWAMAAGDASPPRTVIIKDVGPGNIVLNDPMPNWINHELMFIGGRVDLCVDRESLVSASGVDSVVFGYRFGDAPGVPNQLDPTLGWVRINVDTYGSLCVDWFTDQLDSLDLACADGRFAIAAWVYDRAGNVDHSNIVHVMVDNTDPYTEIVDIDGDETFGDCHNVDNSNPVLISAVAVDDKSCAGPESAFNSGARFLQFFVGQCGEGGGGSGIADIVFVIDYSGSMSAEIANAQAAAIDFANALGGSGLDFNLALVEACSPMTVAQTMTSSTSAFITAINSAGCSGGVQSYDALTGITDGTVNVGFRSGSSRFIVLITDTSPESGTASSINFTTTPSPAEETTVANALVAGGVTLYAIVELPGVDSSEDHNAYDGIITATGGSFYDLAAASYTAMFTEIANNIVVAAASGTGDTYSIIWGKTVDLDAEGASMTAMWDPSGVAPGTYCAWTVAIDQVGNGFTSATVDICVRDITPPIAWIAGFGDAVVACPTCELHRIYARTCDVDVTGMTIERRAAGSTSEEDWIMIGLGTAIDSSLWYADWNQCGLSGDWELRAVPTSDHYSVDTEDHLMYDVDHSVAPILTVTINADCSISDYASGDVTAIEIEDYCFGNLANLTVDAANTIDKLFMLGVYQPLNENSLMTEKVDLAFEHGSSVTYQGHFDDSDILEGGTGMFWASYYSGMVSYLEMADITVFRVYPALGLPGTITNVTTGATVSLEPGAVSATNGVYVLPARQKTRSWEQRAVQIWGYEPGWVTAVRFTTPLESLDNGYATIKISYGAGAPTDLSELFIGYYDDATNEWVYNDGETWIGPDAAGWDTENHTVEFNSKNLHCQFAVLSLSDCANCFSMKVEHHHIEPWSNSYTSMCPTIWTKVTSQSELDPNLLVVWLNDDIIHENGNDAEGWTTTWDAVNNLVRTEADCDGIQYGGVAKIASLAEGEYTIKVRAQNTQGACCEADYTFSVDGTPPDVFMDDDSIYVTLNPTFTFRVSDALSGVNYDSIFVDLFDITASVGCTDCYDGKFAPVDKWFYTETPTGITEGDNGELYFQLTPHIADYRRIRAVIYDGTRTISADLEEGSQYIYPNDHGVPDMVGNHANPLYRMFTVAEAPAMDLGEAAHNKPNPFDPTAGGHTTIYLSGTTDGVVDVTIYDLAGVRVATLRQNAKIGDCNDDGPGTVFWHGQTDDGTMVADGVYLCHVATRDKGLNSSEVLKIAVVKGE